MTASNLTLKFIYLSLLAAAATRAVQAETTSSLYGWTTYTSVALATVTGAQSLESVPTSTTTSTCTEIVVARQWFWPKTTMTPDPQDQTYTYLVNATSFGTAPPQKVNATITAFNEITVGTAAVTTTVTDTSTSTTTVTSSLTVPTPEGFQFISDTTQEDTVTDASILLAAGFIGNLIHSDDSAYPQSVNAITRVMVRYTSLVVETAPTATLTGNAPIRSINATQTATIMSTLTFLDPVASNTTMIQAVNRTATVDPTCSVTKILLSVETATTTATTYAACATPNLLGPRVIKRGEFSPDYLAAPSVPEGNVVGVFVDNTPYDCCVRCTKQPGCIASQYDAETSFCTIYNVKNKATCEPNYQAGSISREDAFRGALDIYSNGYCGVLVDGGLADAVSTAASPPPLFPSSTTPPGRH